ncbi:MAG TPA: hypothetical protein VGK19_20220 [Capsulimonadaceae bacterium]
MKRYYHALLLVLFPCLLLWPVFTGGILLPAHLLADVYPWRTGNPADLVPWNPLQFDGIIQFYPWRLFAAEMLKSGYIPLWNPYEFCGTPFLANSQSAVLYPLNVLFLIFQPAYAFGVSAILHLSMTGLFLYAFLRRVSGLGAGAALLGGAVWQLSTWQVSWLALPSFLDTSAWIPLALLLAHRLASRPSVARAAALGLCLGVMMLAGHLQIAVYGMLLVGAYAVYRAFAERMRLFAVVGLGLLTLTTAFAIDAPQLLPSLELSRVSHRAAEKPSEGGYQGYVRLATPAYQLITLIAPDFFGRPGDRGAVSATQNDPAGAAAYHGETAYWGATNYAENACYVGIAALLLWLIGVAGRLRSSTEVRFFLVTGLVALAVGLGTPLDRLLYFGIPGFSHTGSPARIFCVWTLAAAVLAAYGAQEVFEKRARYGVAAGGFAAVAAVLAAVTAMSLANAGGQPITAILGALGASLRIGIAMAIATGAVLWLHVRGSLRPAAVQSLLVALVAVDLLAVNYGYNRMATMAQVFPDTPAITWLKEHAGSARIMPANREWSLYKAPNAILPPNAATVYGLREVQGYDSLQTAQYKSFAAQLNGGADPSPRENGNMIFTNGNVTKWSQLAGAEYIIAPPGANPAGATYVGPDAVIYTDTGATLLTADDTVQPRIEHISPTRVLIKGSGPVIISDQWYPGWTATQAGKPLAITQGPAVFSTVTSTSPDPIDMRYDPASFRSGLYLALAALASLTALATCWLVAWRRVRG